MAVARITSKGQITIPKEIRGELGVEPGDALDFRFEHGELTVRAIHRRHLDEFRGLFPVTGVRDFTEERADAWSEQSRRLIGVDQGHDA